jgi:hypothetical protein
MIWIYSLFIGEEVILNHCVHESKNHYTTAKAKQTHESVFDKVAALAVAHYVVICLYQVILVLDVIF